MKRQRGYFSDTTQPHLDLSEEILAEILVKLPPKSTTRFKTVSKSWLRLINSTYFIRRQLDFIGSDSDGAHLIHADHEKGNKYINAFLIHDRQVTHLDYTPCLYHSVEHPSKRYFYRISNPINGIYFYSLKPTNSDLAFWIPTIKQVHVLPKTPKPTPVIHHPQGFSIDDDIKGGFVNYGFGFDSSINDYKVVAITTYGKGFSNYHVLSCFQIYSFGTNTWKQLDPSKVSIACPSIQGLISDVGNHSRVSFYQILSPWGGFYVNGACHWYYSYFHLNYEGIYQSIVSFDLKEELFRVYKIPEVINPKVSYPQVACVDGCLGMVCSTRISPISSHVFDVWVMREHGAESSWSKNYTIIIRSDIQISIFLGIVNGEFFVQEDNWLVSYCLQPPYNRHYNYGYLPSLCKLL